MARFAASRILQAIPTMIIVSMLVFGLIRMAPGRSRRHADGPRGCQTGELRQARSAARRDGADQTDSGAVPPLDARIWRMATSAIPSRTNARRSISSCRSCRPRSSWCSARRSLRSLHRLSARDPRGHQARLARRPGGDGVRQRRFGDTELLARVDADPDLQRAAAAGCRPRAMCHFVRIRSKICDG